jgi:hypothetical protein
MAKKKAKPIDDDEEIQPDLSRKERHMELLIRDHAIMTWGELRNVSVLDSETATRIIERCLVTTIAAANRDLPLLQQQVKDLKELGGKIAQELKFQTTRAASPMIDPKGDNRRRCRVCSQPATEHASDCKIPKLLQGARSAGMLTLDDLRAGP